MKNDFLNKIFYSIEKLEIKLWWNLLRKDKRTSILYLTPK